MKEYELKRKIDKFLQEIKMQRSSIGYFYWLNAIAFYVLKLTNDKYNIQPISNVYLYISNKYNKSVSCVEKAMRYAKENSNYKEFFKIEHRLKNNEFIVICADKFVP